MCIDTIVFKTIAYGAKDIGLWWLCSAAVVDLRQEGKGLRSFVNQKNAAYPYRVQQYDRADVEVLLNTQNRWPIVDAQSILAFDAAVDRSHWLLYYLCHLERAPLRY